MANAKQTAVKRLKMSERAQQQLDLHFPNVNPLWVWRRKTNDGYTTLPRSLPVAMQAIDHQSKGQPAGHTLFCLWARSPDHPLVTIENPATFATEAGFEGERAVDTWRRRMKHLQALNFILPKKGPTGDFHFVLLLNPNVAMEYMRWNGKIQQDLYARFLDRVIEVGAYSELEAIRGAKSAQEKAEAEKAAADKAAAEKAAAENTQAGPAAEGVSAPSVPTAPAPTLPPVPETVAPEVEKAAGTQVTQSEA